MCEPSRATYESDFEYAHDDDSAGGNRESDGEPRFGSSDGANPADDGADDAVREDAAKSIKYGTFDSRGDGATHESAVSLSANRQRDQADGSD